MMYLIAQTWLFLAIACLIGIVIGHFLGRDQKSERQAQLEAEAVDARNRAIGIEKEIEEYKLRLAELEGLPQGARASRVAAREEMSTRLSQLERELATAQTAEKRLGEESNRLKVEVDSFRVRYLEARAKWDEYQAKAEALASAPTPVNLSAAQIVPDESMRRRVLELEGLLSEASRERERMTEHARSLGARKAELERQVLNAGQGSDKFADAAKQLQSRISELEGSLATAARERDGALQQAQGLTTRARELERQVASAGQGNDKTLELAKTMQGRIGELEGGLANISKERDGAASQVQTLSTRLGETERQLAGASQGSERNAEAARVLQARITELESRLASGFSAAREADALRSRVADLQDKLGEAEVAMSRSITTTRQETDPLRSRVAELEARLSAVVSAPVTGDTLHVLATQSEAGLRAQLEAAEAQTAAALQKLAALEAAPRAIVDGSESRRLAAQVSKLEQELEVSRRQAHEAQTLRTQIVNLESRLAEAHAAAERGTGVSGGEDVALLKARLADVEGRLMSSSQSSLESDSLRNRVITLEALLHEAAKSRDEAAVLRSKVAELDGRLGQAMKTMAETRPRKAESEPA